MQRQIPDKAIENPERVNAIDMAKSPNHVPPSQARRE